jgi:hypothetical protein
MWRKRQTEQMMLLQNQGEMENYLGYLVHNTEYVIDDVRVLFLEQFPGEEHFFDEYVSNNVE